MTKQTKEYCENCDFLIEECKCDEWENQENPQEADIDLIYKVKREEELFP